MTGGRLADAYAAYLRTLNDRRWGDLAEHVRDDVVHNGRRLGLTGYRAMLEDDVARIPDLRFTAELLVDGPPMLAARLWFDCTPAGEFLGLPVNGRRVRFAEHVIYRYDGGRIAEVRSVLDKAAIEQQLLTAA